MYFLRFYQKLPAQNNINPNEYVRVQIVFDTSL